MASRKGNVRPVPGIGFILNALSAAVWPIWALTVAGFIAQMVALAFVQRDSPSRRFLQVLAVEAAASPDFCELCEQLLL